MGKEKIKSGKGNSKKHLHARISYLHQASTYLAAQLHGKTSSNADATLRNTNGSSNDVNVITSCESGPPQQTIAPNKEDALSEGHDKGPGKDALSPVDPGLAAYLASNVRAVALKSQIRLGPDIKHSVCKVCCSPLLDGTTSSRSIENLSRGGRKPWADVLCIKCLTCGASKSFPVGAQRQKSRRVRLEDTTETSAIPTEGDGPTASHQAFLYSPERARNVLN